MQNEILHTAYLERFTLQLPALCVSECAHQGDCSADVARWAMHRDVSAQFDTIEPDDLRAELREYGAWDDAELSDTAENRERMLWIAACNISDSITPLRETASEWHSGQSSPLYAFSSSGTMLDGLAAEVRECIPDADADDATALNALLDHIGE